MKYNIGDYVIVDYDYSDGKKIGKIIKIDSKIECVKFDYEFEPIAHLTSKDEIVIIEPIEINGILVPLYNYTECCDHDYVIPLSKSLRDKLLKQLTFQ